MTDEGGDVERGAAPLQGRQVFREALEIPDDALAQHLQRHALDVGQVAQGPVAVAGPAGRDGEAAVADHHRGDAEAGRRREPRVPGRLRVVVGVAVDDPGHQRQALGIHFLAARADVAAQFRDAPARDRQIADRSRGPVAVVEPGVPDDQVVHDVLAPPTSSFALGVPRRYCAAVNCSFF